jgi:hypothetical protein
MKLIQRLTADKNGWTGYVDLWNYSNETVSARLDILDYETGTILAIVSREISAMGSELIRPVDMVPGRPIKIGIDCPDCVQVIGYQYNDQGAGWTIPAVDCPKS